MDASAVDNPRFLAARMGAFLGWRGMEAGTSYAEAQPITVPNGQRLFASKCSACHTIGKGDKLGSDRRRRRAARARMDRALHPAAGRSARRPATPIASALYNNYRKIGMPNLRLGSSDVPTW